MAINNERINLFNGFTLDLARGCVLRDGEEVHLRPQSYEVLKYLVENQGHLISKDKLIEEVWKGRAVTDGSLGKCIEEVRDALGPDAPQYVRNVRGRGYIFDSGLEERGDETGSTRSEQIDVVRVVVEDEEETDGVETARAVLPPAIVVPRPRFEWRSGRNATALAAAGLLVVTLLLVIGYRFFISRQSNSASIKSIAVLPFQNESGNPEVEYLSDGLTESLINRMSQLPGVKVIARSSSFKYKGKEVDPQEVARSLGVEAIMTGRVLQRGENLLISAELVDARDGTQVWGEQYNRKASDLLLVQADISREIAETLRLRLTASERQQLAKRETVNPQAYEILLKGRFSRSKGGTENRKKAIEFFNQAIAADPAYAVAYADLAASYSSLVTASTLDPKEFMPKAESAAYKALELDESLAEAHLAMAGTKLIAWNWAHAERELKLAIDLNPNLASARAFYSFYLSLMGRHDEAITEVKHARELDPLSPAINAEVGNRLLLARQYDQAIEAAKNALELDQNRPGAHIQLGYIYAAKGQYADAIAAYQEGIKLGDHSPDTQIYLAAAYAKAGEGEQARVILKRLEARKEYFSPGALADLYVALGEREQAFASLERAYAEHDAQLQFLRVDPNLDPLRSDPRFQDLLRRVGLAQ
ncbi:MAG TPA: winged helix-turn-helix domain-containing protein [Pyrinomonadaceae bacterium]|nr:winged helix-turn-helix domain-containing protein [Pyrinomonadaceae bacterium]